MKQIVTLLLLMCSLSVSAQDIIVKKNGQPIKCRIVEETADEIVYKKWEDINGSNYVMNRQDALSVTRDETLVRTVEPIPSSAADQFSTQYDDEYLKMLDAQRHPFVMKQPLYTQRLKRLKWTAVGTAVGAGVLALGSAITVFAAEEPGPWPLFLTCICGMTASATTSITTGIWYGTLKKKVRRNIYSASLYEQGYTFKNGTRFSASTDLLRDNRTNQTAIGLGFHYNF